jgi:L-2-hydroxyglutarate oxidase
MYDIAIIGGGIVGLATAYRLTESFPDASIAVLEKENRVAAHQTGRNSGVVHSGVFYTPGSLKAKNCREGKRALVRFCHEHDVDVEMCGKVVVAANEREVPELRRIQEKGRLNQVEARPMSLEELGEREPHVRGVAALHVPQAGIVDYTGMAEALAQCVVEAGHDVKTGAAVRDLRVARDRVTVVTTAGDVEARHVVNCAGLYANRIADMSGKPPQARIIPFRGEYYELVPERRHLCRHLIYPVPDPSFPFLGVHFTRMVDGSIECGPSAVLAFAREGYRLTDVNWEELKAILTFPGFLKLSMKHWRKGVQELLQSLSKRVYLQAARHLIPEVQMEDFVPSPSGVRAQALRPNGELVDDFLIEETSRVVNVINAASPAATASLNIGKLIVRDYLQTRLSSTQVRAA